MMRKWQNRMAWVRVAMVAVAAAGLSPGGALAEEDGYRLTRVRFYPMPGQAAAMVGGKFTGSAVGATTDAVTLAEVKSAPVEGQWNEIAVEKASVYRYLKYEAPAGSHGRVAEIEFYSGAAKIPAAKVFGTYGHWNKEAPTHAKAFDGDTGTVFESVVADHQYCGIELPAEALAPALSFSPDPVWDKNRGASEMPISVTIRGGESAMVRYTVDGTVPSESTGMQYTGPIRVERNTFFTAVSFAPGKSPNGPVTAVYRVGPDAMTEPLVRTFHAGNSLSDIVANGALARVAGAAGRNIDVRKHTAPGITTPALWKATGGFGDTNHEEAFSKRKIDHLFTQPYGSGVKQQVQASGDFYELCRKYNPEVQHWLYAQWPPTSNSDSIAEAKGEFASLGLKPAKTWEEGVLNQMKYVEHVKAAMDAADPSRKATKIVPAGLALVNLKREIDAGRMPGAEHLFPLVYTDGLHMNAKGCYFVALVFYACIYEESPEGKVSAVGTGLSEEQARIMQRVAWETVRAYGSSPK